MTVAVAFLEWLGLLSLVFLAVCIGVTLLFAISDRANRACDIDHDCMLGRLKWQERREAA